MASSLTLASCGDETVLLNTFVQSKKRYRVLFYGGEVVWESEKSKNGKQIFLFNFFFLRKCDSFLLGILLRKILETECEYCDDMRQPYKCSWLLEILVNHRQRPQKCFVPGNVYKLFSYPFGHPVAIFPKSILMRTHQAWFR